MRLPDVSSLGASPVPEAAKNIPSYNPSASYEQLANLGTTVEDVGQKALQMDDEAAVKSAYIDFSSQLRQKVWNPETGIYALTGKQAVDAYDPTVKSIQELREQTLQNLSPRQQNMFQDLALRRTEQELNTMDSHISTQRKNWQKSVSTGIIDNAVQTGGDYYNDDNKFYNSVLPTIRHENNNLVNNGFLTPEEADAKTRKEVGEAIYNRVTKMINADAFGAQDTYRQNYNNLAPDQQQDLGSQTRAATQQKSANGVTQAIMAGHGTPDIPSLFTAMEQEESGGNQNAISGKGAVGIMQIMPDTAKDVAVKLGVAYDPQKLAEDPEYNKALGQEYMKEMLQRYNGNQTLALAAYNAGSAQADKWIGQFGDPSRGEISDLEFISKIPFAETKKYVADINLAAPTKPGTLPSSADPTVHADDWKQAGDEFAKNVSSDGNYANLVNAGVDTNVNQIKSAQDAKQADITKQAWQQANQSGGTLNIPPAIWAGLDASEQNKILAAMKQISKGGEPPRNDALVYNLRQQALNNPNDFVKTNLLQYSAYLPKADFDRIMSLQESLSRQDTKAMQDGVLLKRADTISKDILTQANITEKTNPDLFKQYHNNIIDEVKVFHDQNGKAPSDADLRNMVINQLRQVSVPGALYGRNQSTYLAASAAGTKDIQEIVPDDFQKGISAAFQSKNGRAPTDSEIQYMYLKSLKK